MKKFLFLVFALSQLMLFAQDQDIEILEEMGESTIKLYAVNKTSSDLDMTFSINLIGFVSDESSPLNKILKPDVKQYLMTLTAPSGVNCEYKTSVSYKKIRKQGDITETKNKKQRMTSIQMNTNKINIFTQDGCGRCEFVIDFLEKNSIPYVELNTSIHQPNQQLMFEKLEEAGFKGNSVQMPVVYHSGKTVYNIKDLSAYVKSLK